MHSGRLVTSQLKRLWAWADELNAVVAASARKVCALREEPIARVNCIGAGLFRRTDNFVDVQVRLDWLALNTNSYGFVGERSVVGLSVLARVHRDSFCASLKC